MKRIAIVRLHADEYNESMIMSFSGVTKRFGAFPAVKDASFTVEKGAVVGFVGANGAGKSTTINMLLGFLNPSEGSIRLFDEAVLPQTAHHQHARLGYAAGDMELPRRLTGRQYLDFVAYQTGRDTSVRREELCAIFQPELGKKIGALSRGNKQKIALIAAFLASPELVVLDEPTSGLDPIMQDKFLQLVRDEQAKGVTVFMSSHYLNEVADVCSRVLLMRKGEIIEDMSASELLKQGGKQVRVVTGAKLTKAPETAEEVKAELEGETLILSFVWKGSASELQRWLGGLKKLEDIEVTEYNLEETFQLMYEHEERPV